MGSHLAEEFENRGDVVLGIDDFTTGREENYPIGAVGDVADRHWLYQKANHFRPDLVVHCAASYSDPNLWHRDTDTNVTGSINVALMARHHGAEVIYFQTILPPISSYAISKIAGEHYLRLSGVPLTVYKLANIYGPRNISGAVPAFYRKLQSGERAVVTRTKRSLVYIDDVVEAVMGNERHGTFGLAGDDFEIPHLYLMMSELLDVHGNHEEIDSPPDDVPYTRPEDPPPAGWTATTPLAEGLLAAIDWYDRHGVDAAYTHLELKA